MITLCVTKKGLEKGVKFTFPSSVKDYYTALAELESVNPEDKITRVIAVYAVPFSLRYPLCEAYIYNNDHIKMLNEIAWKVENMCEDDLHKLHGILKAEPVHSLADAFEYINRINEYIQIHGVTDPLSLGEKLCKSGYLDIPKHLDKYIDYAGIGREYYDSCGGAFTAEGYVVRKDCADFSLRMVERLNTTKYWFDEDDLRLSWIYFNPDSNSGGQYVESYADSALLKRALNRTSNMEAFLDFLEVECELYFIDSDHERFEETDENFLTDGCDSTKFNFEMYHKIETAIMREYMEEEPMEQQMGGM